MKYRSKKRRRPLVPVLAVLAALGIAFAVPDSGEKPVESQKVQQAEDGEQAGSRRKSAGRASGGSTGESSPAGKAENAAPVPVGDQEAETAVSFNLSQVPAYAGNPAYVVNGNVPFFSEADLTTAPFENYSPLDALGRCGTAYANVCRDIMPTEPRGEIGLDAGADDYLTKPFAMKELLARVRSITRRKGEVTDNELSFGDLTLDRFSYTLSCGTESVRLQNKEFQLMEMLLKNPGQIFSADQFMDKIWGYDSDTEMSVVWVYISYLRKKLSKIGSTVKITATRGVGYSLSADEGGE